MAGISEKGLSMILYRNTGCHHLPGHNQDRTGQFDIDLIIAGFESRPPATNQIGDQMSIVGVIAKCDTCGRKLSITSHKIHDGDKADWRLVVTIEPCEDCIDWANENGREAIRELGE